MIQPVLDKDLDDLEPKLTRYGYNLKALADVLSVRPHVIRSFLRGKLPPGKTQEIQTELLAAGDIGMMIKEKRVVQLWTLAPIQGIMR